jgi:hypothetical protein
MILSDDQFPGRWFRGKIDRGNGVGEAKVVGVESERQQSERQGKNGASVWGPTRELINLEESAKAEFGHGFVGSGLQHALSMVERDQDNQGRTPEATSMSEQRARYTAICTTRDARLPTRSV